MKIILFSKLYFRTGLFSCSTTKRFSNKVSIWTFTKNHLKIFILIFLVYLTWYWLEPHRFCSIEWMCILCCCCCYLMIIHFKVKIYFINMGTVRNFRSLSNYMYTCIVCWLEFGCEVFLIIFFRNSGSVVY